MASDRVPREYLKASGSYFGRVRLNGRHTAEGAFGLPSTNLACRLFASRRQILARLWRSGSPHRLIGLSTRECGVVRMSVDLNPKLSMHGMVLCR